MKLNLLRSGVIASLTLALSACVVAPAQPYYSVATVAVPTYVTQTQVPSAATTATYQQPVVIQPAPVYVRPAPAMVYVRPAPYFYPAPIYLRSRIYF